MSSLPSGSARRLERVGSRISAPPNRGWLAVVGWVLIASSLILAGFIAWESWGTELLGRQLAADALAQTRQALDDGESGVLVTDLRGGGEVSADDPTLSGVPVGSDDFKPSDFAQPSAPAPSFSPGVSGPPGTGFGVLSIPDIGLEVALVEGVSAAELKVGVGHMPLTPLPGELGNSVISGHRTTWGKPFNRVDELQPGSRIVVETSWGTHIFEVTDQFIVKPDEIWVAGPIEGSWLTLTSCHPKGSARERIITRARLIDSPNLAYVNYMWGTDWPSFDTSAPRWMSS